MGTDDDRGDDEEQVRSLRQTASPIWQVPDMKSAIVQASPPQIRQAPSMMTLPNMIVAIMVKIMDFCLRRGMKIR